MKPLPTKEMVLSDYMLSTHHCSFLEKLGQKRVGGIGQVGRIVSNCTNLLSVIETIQKRKLSLAGKELHRRRCNMNKKLPKFRNLFKIWAYLLMTFTLMKGGCNAERKPNNGPENNFNLNYDREQEIDWNIPENNFNTKVVDKNPKNGSEKNINTNIVDRNQID